MKRILIATAFLLANSAVAITQDQVEVPQEVLKEMAFLVGEWQGTGVFQGEEIRGSYSAQWAPGKHCLRLANRWTGAINSYASGIGGWSPDKKQYVEYWYSSDGYHRTHRYSLDEKTRVWVGTFTQVDREGRTSTGKARIEKNGDSYTFTVSDDVDGKEIAQATFTKTQ